MGGAKSILSRVFGRDSLLEHPDEIRSHIYSFFQGALLSRTPRWVSLVENFWPLEDRVSDIENAELTIPSSLEEVGRAIASMKAGSAPGPDGILALHEIVHEVKTCGHKGVFLKLDFQKAYDRLDWSFLRLALQQRGFDDRWCSWIMQFFRSVRTAININGDVGPFFTSSAGVKQRDPISPLHFNLAVDALLAT